MQTRFRAEQLADSGTVSAEAVIRSCVHCGFCTATCPTYVLLGDELDSPRGRIYLAKEMLENEAPPTPEVVRHLDRCLSCLSCMTTCPSGVNYMHLMDHTRAYVEEKFRRPLTDRFIRWLLATVLPHPRRFRLALRLAPLARPLGPLLRGALQPLKAMLALAPRRVPARRAQRPEHLLAPRGRVVLMRGCAEPVLRPEIPAAALRLLQRCGYQVQLAAGEGCCGALVHHLGSEARSLEAARKNVDAWLRDPPDAILITASGCGTTVKDYGFMLRDDPAYAAKAARVSALARDITEWLATVKMPATRQRTARVAYHAACSLQHGQRVVTAPGPLLRAAGFEVFEPAEAHLCCGSAGTYNILQSDLAAQLGARKVENLMRCRPDVIATGNIGCATQIASLAAVPVVHTIQLLDWATGGPKPF